MKNKKMTLVENWFLHKKLFELKCFNFDLFYCKSNNILNKFGKEKIFAIVEFEKETSKAFLLNIWNYKLEKCFKIWVPKVFCLEKTENDWKNEFEYCNCLGI